MSKKIDTTLVLAFVAGIILTLFVIVAVSP